MVKIYRGIGKMKKNNFKIIELKPTKDNSTIKRTVFIKDFIIEEIIGFYKHEKEKIIQGSQGAKRYFCCIYTSENGIYEGRRFICDCIWKKITNLCL